MGRQQFELASQGNTTMLIWLDKQYLGQTDKPNDKEVNVEELAKQLSSALEELTLRRHTNRNQSSNAHV